MAAKIVVAIPKITVASNNKVTVEFDLGNVTGRESSTGKSTIIAQMNDKFVLPDGRVCTLNGTIYSKSW